ncbi:hypothetical protein D3C87_910600 [compost metagenome]
MLFKIGVAFDLSKVMVFTKCGMFGLLNKLCKDVILGTYGIILPFVNLPNRKRCKGFT